MQPLTPNERRAIEGIKELIIRGYGSHYGIGILDDDDNLIIPSILEENKDLWLKVLSMCLEHNEKLTDEWRSKR